MKLGTLIGVAAVGISFAAGISWGASTYPFADDFESYETGVSILGSNGWCGDTNVVYAVVTNLSYTFTPTTRPLTNSTHEKVVVLNTEGSVVSNAFEPPPNPNEPTDTNVFIDMMFKVVLSDSVPDNLTNQTDVQVAFFFDTNGYLVVWHTKYYGLNEELEPIYSNQFTVVTNVTVSTDEWSRITVTMDYLTDFWNDRKYFKIAINGQEAISEEGYADPSVDNPGGPWFICANIEMAANRYLSAVALAGSGLLDDFVVSTEPPTFGAGQVAITAQVWPTDGRGGSIDPSGIVYITQGGNAAFTITASNLWHISQILTNGNNIGFITNELELANVTEDINLLVQFAPDLDSNNVPLYMYPVWGWNPNNPPPPDDGDGIPYYEEWLASTDPNDSNSYFRVIAIGQENNTNYIEWVTRYVDPMLGPFGIQKSTNLVEGWMNANPATHPRTEGTNRWWEATPSLGIPEFFRVNYTNAP